ncbi:hypothetical protein BDW02DRAFT_564962 [Decorospora gaudefroyi]|uniref:Uncharacterized protein n=1 Tax=Decorospora gaudefroyi TaxID=184978 RepID=A0A6A5KJ10_9PLEO|nr:hypothetical protein BDW02DRAFT_564962 [Decorospora gaudefroyi]
MSTTSRLVMTSTPLVPDHVDNISTYNSMFASHTLSNITQFLKRTEKEPQHSTANTLRCISTPKQQPTLFHRSNTESHRYTPSPSRTEPIHPNPSQAPLFSLRSTYHHIVYSLSKKK